MKLYKFIMSAVAAVALASCSDSGYWTDGASSVSANYTFQAASQKFTYGAELPEYVTVFVNRSSASGAATVAIKAEGEIPGATFPAEVVFADGKAQAEYNIKIDNSLPYGSNEVVLAIDANVLDYNIAQTKITLEREYTYTTIGIGHIASEGWGGDWDVEVQRQDGDPHIFRIIDPYYVLDSDGSGVWYITCNDDYTQATFKNFYIGVENQGMDLFWHLAAPGTIEGNNITFPVDYYAVDGSEVYTFGCYNETITMPTGWK